MLAYIIFLIILNGIAHIYFLLRVYLKQMLHDRAQLRHFLFVLAAGLKHRLFVGAKQAQHRVVLAFGHF